MSDQSDYFFITLSVSHKVTWQALLSFNTQTREKGTDNQKTRQQCGHFFCCNERPHQRHKYLYSLGDWLVIG